ncbi:MAG: hypothetical protein HQK52_05110 [Oligoflexia bacterium]|nr:hypothetical protein [Oligoflexia bacterium]
MKKQKKDVDKEKKILAILKKHKKESLLGTLMRFMHEHSDLLLGSKAGDCYQDFPDPITNYYSYIHSRAEILPRREGHNPTGNNEKYTWRVHKKVKNFDNCFYSGKETLISKVIEEFLYPVNPGKITLSRLMSQILSCKLFYLKKSFSKKIKDISDAKLIIEEIIAESGKKIKITKNLEQGIYEAINRFLQFKINGIDDNILEELASYNMDIKEKEEVKWLHNTSKKIEEWLREKGMHTWHPMLSALALEPSGCKDFFEFIDEKCKDTNESIEFQDLLEEFISIKTQSNSFVTNKSKINLIDNNNNNNENTCNIVTKNADLQKQFSSATTKKKGTTKIKQPITFILEGAPGTGKTLTMQLVAQLIAEGNKNITRDEIEKISKTKIEDADIKKHNKKNEDQNIFNVQFHPSYSYEEFIEGLRPVENLENKGSVRYHIVKGPLLIATNLANAYLSAYSDKPFYIEFHAFITSTNGNLELIIPKEYAGFCFESRPGFIIYWNEQEKKHFVLAKTGEDSKIRSGQSATIPITGVAGLPRGYCSLSWSPLVEDNKKIPQFVVCIDELNRGTPSRIFGELLTQIEPSKRLGAENQAPLILPASKEKITIPQNLHFICARNLADKNLTLIDLAFLRRFNRLKIGPNWKLVKKFEMIKKHFENINNAIIKVLGANMANDLLLGHYYGLETEKLVKKSCTIEKAIEIAWRWYVGSQIREILCQGHRYNHIKEKDFCDALTRMEAKGGKNRSGISGKMLKKILDEAFDLENKQSSSDNDIIAGEERSIA